MHKNLFNSLIKKTFCSPLERLNLKKFGSHFLIGLKLDFSCLYQWTNIVYIFTKAMDKCSSLNGITGSKRLTVHQTRRFCDRLNWSMSVKWMAVVEVVEVLKLHSWLEVYFLLKITIAHEKVRLYSTSTT